MELLTTFKRVAQIARVTTCLTKLFKNERFWFKLEL